MLRNKRHLDASLFNRSKPRLLLHKLFRRPLFDERLLLTAYFDVVTFAEPYGT